MESFLGILKTEFVHNSDYKTRGNHDGLSLIMSRAFESHQALTVGAKTMHGSVIKCFIASIQTRGVNKSKLAYQALHKRLISPTKYILASHKQSFAKIKQLYFNQSTLVEFCLNYYIYIPIFQVNIKS